MRCWRRRWRYQRCAPAITSRMDSPRGRAHVAHTVRLLFDQHDSSGYAMSFCFSISHAGEGRQRLPTGRPPGSAPTRTRDGDELNRVFVRATLAVALLAITPAQIYPAETLQPAEKKPSWKMLLITGWMFVQLGMITS